MRYASLFLLAFLAGCDTRVLEDPDGPAFDDTFLMPLDSANRWTYQMTRTSPAEGDTSRARGQLAFEIAGTERLGQTDFAVLEVRSDGLAFPPDFGGFLRNSNEGLVKLPPNASERFVFRYPIGFSASYTMPATGSPTGLSEVALSVEDIAVPAGTFTCHVYEVVTPGSPTRHDAYAPGLGLVRREIEGRLTLELVAYDLQPPGSPDG